MTQSTTATEAPTRNPFDLGVVEGSKHYFGALATTEQGRWTVLVSGLFAILDHQITAYAYPDSMVGIWSQLLLIVVFAMLLNVAIDAVQYAAADDGGGD